MSVSAVWGSASQSTFERSELGCLDGYGHPFTILLTTLYYLRAACLAFSGS